MTVVGSIVFFVFLFENVNGFKTLDKIIIPVTCFLSK